MRYFFLTLLLHRTYSSRIHCFCNIELYNIIEGFDKSRSNGVYWYNLIMTLGCEQMFICKDWGWFYEKVEYASHKFGGTYDDYMLNNVLG